MKKLLINHISEYEFYNYYTIYRPYNFGWIIKNYTEDYNYIKFLWKDGTWQGQPCEFSSRREAIQCYKCFINAKNCIVANENHKNGDIIVVD